MVARELWRRESDVVEVTATGGRRKGNGVNPTLGRPMYRGSTESARCGSVRRTTRLNAYDLNPEFRSSTDQEDNIMSS
jgi:hypothetical protein